MTVDGGQPEILVFGLEDDDPDVQDRLFGLKRDTARYAREPVPVERLERQVSDLVASLGGIVTSLPSRLGDFAVDELTFSAQVSAKGTVSLLGTGGEISGQGGITIKLKRKLAGE